MSEPLAVREAPASYALEVGRASARYVGLKPDLRAIPQGYKQTEVGVIPEDWDATSLGHLKVLMTNGFVGTATRHYAPNDNGVLYIQGYNVEENSFNFHGIKYVTAEFHKVHAKSCLRGGDLLTVQTGDVGLTTVVPDYLAGSNCHALIISRFNKQSVSPTFISYYLNSFPGRSRLRLIETGTTMKHLNIGDMLEFPIPLPPTKAEQEAIAEALSDADALIESLEQLVAKKRHLKQGAMQEQLTGKKRLLGFGGEWEVKRLDAVAEIRSGGTPSTNQPAFWDGDVLWCTPTDITALNGFKYLTQTARMITAQGLKASSAELIPANSVVMTSRATIGECAINAAPVATNQGFKNFVPFEETDGEFLYYLLQTKKQGFISLCGGSTFLEIGKTQLAAFEIELPKEKVEQTAIATLLSDMDTEIAALEAQLAKARGIKQGMMQELLTGKIRLGTLR